MLDMLLQGSKVEIPFFFFLLLFMSICGEDSEALFCLLYNKPFKEGKATIRFCFLFAYGLGSKRCTPLLSFQNSLHN